MCFATIFDKFFGWFATIFSVKLAKTAEILGALLRMCSRLNSADAWVCLLLDGSHESAAGTFKIAF